MGVTSQDPTLVGTPDRFIRCIRVMAEYQRRGIMTFLLEHLSRIEARAPQVIDADKLYPTNDSRFVAEQCNSRRAYGLGNLLCHIQHPPSVTIVVVSENAHSSKAAVWHVGQNALQLIELVRPSIGNPVAGENYKVRADLLDSADRKSVV